MNRHFVFNVFIVKFAIYFHLHFLIILLIHYVDIVHKLFIQTFIYICQLTCLLTLSILPRNINHANTHLNLNLWQIIGLFLFQIFLDLSYLLQLIVLKRKKIINLDYLKFFNFNFQWNKWGPFVLLRC